jgi:hypothetical protein
MRNPGLKMPASLHKKATLEDIARRARKGGTLKAWRDFKSGWYRGPERKKVRKTFRTRCDYWKSFQPTEEDITEGQDLLLAMGKQAFRWIETALLRAARRQRYISKGQQAVGELTAALIEGRPLQEDHLLLSLDFEGGDDQWGVREFGAAWINTQQILSTELRISGCQIETENYNLSKWCGDRFHFGHTTRTHEALLPQTIRRILTSRECNPNGRDIILIGHGIRSDLLLMESLSEIWKTFHKLWALMTQRTSRRVDCET